MDDLPIIRICTFLVQRVAGRKILCLLTSCLLWLGASQSSNGQSVGLVMSGGAALGLAHIGVIKALEEKGIPIDHIVGTSMGGIVGAFYAAGYSPEEIEELVLSPEFQDWVTGNLEDRYRYLLFEKDKDAAISYFKFGLNEAGKIAFKSSFVDDNALDFVFAEYLSRASAAARNNFDSLLVPYRCITTDIFTQTSIVMKEGNLSDAVKATMTIPLFFSPVKVDGKYLFDGGIYDNFPVKPAQENFHSDVLVGINVSSVTLQEYPLDKDEKYLPRLLDYLLIAKSDSLEVIKNGIYLQPDLYNFSAFDFKKGKELIQAGYDCAMAKMDQFEQKIERRISKENLQAKRATFRSKFPPWKFKPTELICLTGKSSLYARRMVNLKPEKLSLEHIKNTYFRLAETGNFESLHPTFLYDTTDATYQMCLQTKPNRNIEIGIGGSIASRNISHIFLAMNYRRMAKYSYTFSGSVYAGPFYNSIAGSWRLDYPTRIPFYLKPEFVFNIWDYIEVNDFFFNVDEGNIALKQNDLKMGMEAGLATGRQS